MRQPQAALVCYLILEFSPASCSSLLLAYYFFFSGLISLEKCFTFFSCSVHYSLRCSFTREFIDAIIPLIFLVGIPPACFSEWLYFMHALPPACTGITQVPFSVVVKF